MSLRVLLITANAGSIFENIDNGLAAWMQELIKTVEIQQPEFIALHFQETGGKLYKNGSGVIQTFFSVLVKEFKAVGFGLAEGFVDSDSDLQHQFTALSSVYFIRNGIDGIQIWDFQESAFVPVSTNGKLFIGKDLQLTQRKQKQKFPQHFFPNFKWSRKGFLRTRWRLRDTVVDLVNIHLFHDSSNTVAASSSPSPFALNRQRTLNYLLDLFQNDSLDKHPMFIFGDFNFRVDTFKVFPLLQNDLHEKPSSNNHNKFYVDSKTLIVKDHEEKFKLNFNWLLPYDNEAKEFNGLLELDISFHPTYPFDEDVAHQFMRTRCPSWCDRVLFNPLAKLKISNNVEPEYNLVGTDVCMGDHKPVYLAFNLESPEKSTTTNHECRNPEASLMDNETGRNVNSFHANAKEKPRKQCSLVSILKDNLRKVQNSPCSSGPSVADVVHNNKVPSPSNCNGSCKIQSHNCTTAESVPNNATNNLLMFSPNELILKKSSTVPIHKNGQADEPLLIERASLANSISIDKDSSVILGTDDGCCANHPIVSRKKVKTPKRCCCCCII